MSGKSGDKESKIDEIGKLLREMPLDQLLQLKENLTNKESGSASAQTQNPVPEDVIDLVDSDEEEVVILPKAKDKGKKSAVVKDCLNPLCQKTDLEFYQAPHFVMAHFFVRKKKKQQFVCGTCFDLAIAEIELLVDQCKNGTPVFKMKLPQRADVIEIDSDSDSDDEEQEEIPKEEYLTQEELVMLNTHFEPILADIIERLDPSTAQQMVENYLWDHNSKMETEIEMLQEVINDLSEKSYKTYRELYESCKLKVREQKPLHMIQHFDQFGEPSSLTYDEPKEKEKLIETRPPTPQASSKKSTVQSSVTYFGMRTSLLDRWVPCKLVENLSDNFYKVRFTRSRKNLPDEVTLSGNLLAQTLSCPSLDVGTRVIANFNDHQKQKRFIPGVVGEKKSPMNNDRFLVFADDGSVGYKSVADVRKVLQCSENVWEDVHENLKAFIMDYIKDHNQQKRKA
jgi:hypothetical protein